ncbi:S8 family serine peptidase [Oscillatoria sp. CS-180]|uniref:S8 family serine peptidase n=1 Tax=Oscillatoria sp. CS-180 TaxID=3021720 RepID=UPI00232D6700|nr:S8 family serine peptidase [Oscillatoria sp. CS-180]MDB9526221.1 S8 family serine peptidase [Oscillatoria sp. CS-180]
MDSRKLKALLRNWQTYCLGVAGVAGVGLPALALSSSVGVGGIDALRLHSAPYFLTGEKIAIGQVEIGRPSQFGLDKVADADLPVKVDRVFFLDQQPTPNQYVDGHAANVASVMVSQDKTLTGVAPDAHLYAAAVGPIRGRSGQPEECFASQQLALSNGGDLRAINFSFGESLGRDPRPDAVLDGNALLTLCIDWSQRVHDVLYVVAGNQGGGGIPIPTDNFNGLNVAYSRAVDGQFAKVDFANLSSEPDFRPFRSQVPESNVGDRRSVNIVAPGSQIEVINPDGDFRTVSGTSFAAPHVTATIALLQQWSDRQIRSADWSLDAREPMVMKAVLLNSADKLEDAGDGLLLGMTRTLYDESNLTWLESDAYRDRSRPLHSDLGTGHLNAYRALQQLQGGQWSSNNSVPVIGWSYGTTESPLPPDLPRTEDAVLYQDYVFDVPLQGGSYLSATLAWERLVVLNDENGNDVYDLGESFQNRGLNNLDLYLMRAEDDNIADSVWSSISQEDSLEHIFTQIPETGTYKLRVVYRQQIEDELAQDYALAWWAVPAGEAN